MRGEEEYFVEGEGKSVLIVHGVRTTQSESRKLERTPHPIDASSQQNIDRPR